MSAITPHHQGVGLIVLVVVANNRFVAALRLVLVRRTYRYEIVYEKYKWLLCLPSFVHSTINACCELLCGVSFVHLPVSVLLCYVWCVLLSVDGQWGAFGSWSNCTVTCGGGVQTRKRSCDSPPPSGGGADCVGSSTHQRNCNRDDCPGENTCCSSSSFQILWKTCAPL